MRARLLAVSARVVSTVNICDSVFAYYRAIYCKSVTQYGQSFLCKIIPDKLYISVGTALLFSCIHRDYLYINSLSELTKEKAK